jgi:hypothetical protein
MIVLHEIPLENMAVFGAKPVAEVDLGLRNRCLAGSPRLVWRSNQPLRRRFWELSSQRLGTDHCGGLTLAGLKCTAAPHTR